MSLEYVRSENAPAPVGPYSQAVIVNGMVYTAGMVGLMPETGMLIEGGIQAETRQAFANLRAVLEAAGTSLDNAVKTTVYLQHMSDFAAMNEIYATQFTGRFPARTTIEIAKLPKDALVEIELVAVL